jgi:hypothetical protein
MEAVRNWGYKNDKTLVFVVWDNQENCPKHYICAFICVKSEADAAKRGIIFLHKPILLLEFSA